VVTGGSSFDLVGYAVVGVLAVRQAEGLDAVGDRNQAVRSEQVEGEFQHSGVDVYTVGDDLGCQVGRSEDCQQWARGAMVDRRHCVVQVGDMADAELDGVEGLLIVCG